MRVVGAQPHQVEQPRLAVTKPQQLPEKPRPVQFSKEVQGLVQQLISIGLQRYDTELTKAARELGIVGEVRGEAKAQVI